MKKFLLLLTLVASVAHAEQYFNEAVTNAPLEVKSAKGGNVLGYSIYSPNAAATYLHFYDAGRAADVTVGTTVQNVSPVALPGSSAGGAVIISATDTPQFKFSKGIVIAATTSPLSNVATAPASAIVVTIIYQ